MAAGLLLNAGRANADPDARRALAEELLAAMNMREAVDKSFAMVKQMIPAQMESIKTATGQSSPSSNVVTQAERVMETITAELSWAKMKDEYVTLYAETFTEDEMKGIIAFYKSPAGLAFTKKQPQLMQRSMALSQKMMMQLMPKIQALTSELSDLAPATPAPPAPSVPAE
jgi:hypothetical protein